MKNDSKIKAKGATPGGAKSGASFSKRSGATQKASASGKMKAKDADYGPRKTGNFGATVGDDGAGTRFKVGLPPETTAMKAPAADLPKGASELASATLPVPSADQGPVNAVWGWDYARDQKLGKSSNRGGNGGSGANQ